MLDDPDILCDEQDVDMKKLILPLIVVAASGGYVWTQRGPATADAGLDAQAETPEAPQQAALPKAAEPVAPRPTLPAVQAAVPAAEAAPTAVTDASPTTIAAAPKPHIVRQADPQMAGYVDATPKYGASEPAAPARTQVVANSETGSDTHFADGAFTGAVKDAYYGPLQVKAVIKSGKLTKVQVLQYPDDRRTSRYINGQALPMLQSEAISAQSSDVDFITGATLTSRAFSRSLADALSQAVS
jgi:uncharacterized protein with FMN-binding domain